MMFKVQSFRFIFFLAICIFQSLLVNAVGTNESDPPEKKLILITGCGRSGTFFMSGLLRTAGLKIEHEAPGEDGSSSWCMAVNCWTPWAASDPVGNVEFAHIFQIVRNPLHVITSFYINLFDLTKEEWRFIRRHIPEIHENDSLLVQCAKYWYYWNLKAEKIASWRFRLEDIDQLLPEFEQRLGIHFNQTSLNDLPKNNWRATTKKVKWIELKAVLSPELFQNIQEMAFNYGYSTKDD